MRLSGQYQTLQLDKPFGRALVLAAAMLVLFVGACEAASRNQVLQSALLYAPQISGGLPLVGAKMDYLDELVQRDGPIDCVIVGSSMAERGIDPLWLSPAYEEQTGKPLRCFNFAYHGLGATGAAQLADILSRRYHPRLLIFATALRDYHGGPEFSYPMITPWTEYQLGHFSIQGWLEYELLSYRYFITYRQLLYPNAKLTAREAYREEIIRYGYAASDKVGDVTSPPDPSVNREGFELLENYTISDNELASLKRIIDLKSPETQILLIEIPGAPTYYMFYPNPEQDSQRFVNMMLAIGARENVPFWETAHLNLIQTDGWKDHGHMNSTGARVFSTWLGRMIGRAVQQGEILNPVP